MQQEMSGEHRVVTLTVQHCRPVPRQIYDETNVPPRNYRSVKSSGSKQQRPRRRMVIHRLVRELLHVVVNITPLFAVALELGRRCGIAR
jgi:hypothetical protein